jgi:hypothetical protein
MSRSCRGGGLRVAAFLENGLDDAARRSTIQRASKPPLAGEAVGHYAGSPRNVVRGTLNTVVRRCHSPPGGTSLGDRCPTISTKGIVQYQAEALNIRNSECASITTQTAIRLQ